MKEGDSNALPRAHRHSVLRHSEPLSTSGLAVVAKAFTASRTMAMGCPAGWQHKHRCEGLANRRRLNGPATCILIGVLFCLAVWMMVWTVAGTMTLFVVAAIAIVIAIVIAMIAEAFESPDYGPDCAEVNR